jgi:phosphoglycolate phosphatase-like HAD superfamily hydrolase
VTPPVVLWDVDGTLIRGGAAGRLAFSDAILELLQIEVPAEDLPKMAGKTDMQIAMEILTRLEIADAEQLLPSLALGLERALTARTGQLETEGVVLPGVPAALAALHDAGVVQTLVTGNLAPNARTKLVALGLLGAEEDQPGPLRLELGAYADDHLDRNNLVPFALERIAATGVDVDRDRTWVIGDTPRDLACARAAGVRCLLVATGGYPLSVVAEAGADAVLPDLRDTAGLVELLTA